MQLISQERIEQALDWAYDKSVNGVPGLDSAIELAEGYMKGDGPRIDQVNSLIRFQNTKAATSGFLSGLGGLITLPVAVPANITSVLFVQIRMIAAIAHMGGHDVRDDRVKTLVYSSLVANSAKDVAKNLGITVTGKLATNAIKAIPGRTLVEINQRVGFRLITKFGEKGVVNLGKAVPFLGGLIGGSLDAFATNRIGNVARDTFIAPAPPVAALPDTKRKPKRLAAGAASGPSARKVSAAEAEPTADGAVIKAAGAGEGRAKRRPRKPAVPADAG